MAMTKVGSIEATWSFQCPSTFVDFDNLYVDYDHVLAETSRPHFPGEMWAVYHPAEVDGVPAVYCRAVFRPFAGYAASGGEEVISVEVFEQRRQRA